MGKTLFVDFCVTKKNLEKRAYFRGKLMITLWIRLITKYKSEVILNVKNIIVDNVDNLVDKLNEVTTSVISTIADNVF